MSGALDDTPIRTMIRAGIRVTRLAGFTGAIDIEGSLGPVLCDTLKMTGGHAHSATRRNTRGRAAFIPGSSR